MRSEETIDFLRTIEIMELSMRSLRDIEKDAVVVMVGIGGTAQLGTVILFIYGIFDCFNMDILYTICES